MMNIQDIRNQMRKLWISIFGDPEVYVDMIFDNYFDEKYIDYEIRDGRVVSALIGVPYSFRHEDMELKGLYLCGLSTYHDFRGHGIMTKLIDDINARAARDGFDFTFLIPASSGLIKYYEDRGYVCAVYNNIERFTSNHDFSRNLIDDDIKNDLLTVFKNLRSEIIDFDDKKVCEDAIDYLTKKEPEQPDLTLIHTRRDWSLVFADMKFYGNRLLIVRNVDNQICGVAFVNLDDESVQVKYIIADGRAEECRLLQSVVDMESDLKIDKPIVVINPSLEQHREVLWSPYYNTVLPEAVGVPAFGEVLRTSRPGQSGKVYGMLRVTNVERIVNLLNKISESKIHKNLEAVNRNGDVIISVNNEERYLIKTKNSSKNKVNSEFTKQNNIPVISTKEFSKIVFAPESRSELLSEVFELPSVTLKMAMLLD